MQYKFKSINPKPDKPVKLATFDIETFGLLAGDSYATGFYDGIHYYSWEGINNTLEEFLKHFLTKKYRSYTCYAHNGGKFDFLYLLQSLKQKYPEAIIKPMMQGARIIQLTIRDKNNHTWKLKDSYALLQDNLRNILKNFKCDTQKGDFDHEKINKQNWKTLMPELRPYLEADCKGLYQALKIFEQTSLAETGVSLARVTTTAQKAMRIYRKKFFTQTNLKELPNYQATEKFIRQAYYGGRTEIFKTKGENLNYYDVNSEYPSVMKDNDMPIGTPIKSYDMEINDFGIAYAEVTCPNYIQLPVLPKKHKINGQTKLFFPQGTWTGWYCTPELQKALEVGYTIKIHYGFKFKRARLFNEYIDYFYTKKKESKRGSPINHFSKLCLNSLYGKFGQRRERKEIVINPKDKIGLIALDAYGENNVWSQDKHSDTASIMPAIACFVTCYARLKLYSYMQGDESICYCDTDSILTNKVYPTGKELGQLKLEKQIIKAIFLRPKTYYLEDSEGHIDIKAKGYPKTFREKLTYQNYLDALNGEYKSFAYEGERLMSMPSALRLQKMFLTSGKIKRSMKTPYDKRIILADTTTIPININEIETQELSIAKMIEFDSVKELEEEQ